ncbi:hypothetical protein IKE_05974 [Bacillus cereus VD196]|uniref:histidine kinase n=1 Tax=Bacillus cereus VD196 TaxID=1053243 RepID=A0A9W5V5U5_BACCE|nr:HAMP domain-containing sensor histidine kinase [Bacillus cereus]EJR89799.1 hypothetical protein IKG_05969 [Bacillus cereus VD200]EOO60373.1 hypothetical protein IKE_05974 [Bacillus cereus VD196]
MDFSYINQNVLNNLLYILCSIFVFYFINDNGVFLKNRKKILMLICTGIPLILCMKFPIYIDKYHVQDLRQIPILIGTLYGGFPVGIALLIVMLLFRYWFYGFNFLTIVVYTIILVITTIFSIKFNRFNRTDKLIFSTIFSFFLALFTTFIIMILSDVPITQSYVLYFIILPPVVILFVVYINELLRETVLMRVKLVKIEKMEIVSQLAASISHEVKNPLTVIKGFAQLLKDHSLSKDLRENYIEHILGELNRAQSIIDEYLMFAKPASPNVDNIIIDQELKRVISIMMPLCKEHHITVSDQLGAGVITGNIQHFQQCLLNLIKNGIEAMPHGGTLHVTSRNSENKVIIIIKDSGIGMIKEQIKRFGEPYYSTKIKGTGLGTMVALRIIETMGGTLEINSVVGKGTTLKLTFPQSTENI